MTGCLVDTHVLLWWAVSPNRISSEAKIAIGSGHTALFFSHASLWELNIKISRGKITLPETTDVMMHKARCTPLPISVDHIDQIKLLPHHHADPFDRMLVAQAMSNHLTLITHDREILKYDVPTIAA